MVETHGESNLTVSFSSTCRYLQYQALTSGSLWQPWASVAASRVLVSATSLFLTLQLDTYSWRALQSLLPPATLPVLRVLALCSDRQLVLGNILELLDGTTIAPTPAPIPTGVPGSVPPSPSRLPRGTAPSPSRASLQSSVARHSKCRPYAFPLRGACCPSQGARPSCQHPEVGRAHHA